jgi:hypothetical protein
MEVRGGHVAGWLVVREMEVGTWVVGWLGWPGLPIAIGSPVFIYLFIYLFN